VQLRATGHTCPHSELAQVKNKMGGEAFFIRDPKKKVFEVLKTKEKNPTNF